LRRITTSQAQTASPDVRALYLLLLAQAWRHAGREDKSRVLFAQAQRLAPSPDLALKVEQCAYVCGFCSPSRLAEAAVRAFDSEAARLALNRSQGARKALRHALGEQQIRARSTSPHGPLDALALCMRHGASLAATLMDGEFHVLPAHAQVFAPGLKRSLLAPRSHRA
jgi:hypothetical protein